MRVRNTVRVSVVFGLSLALLACSSADGDGEELDAGSMTPDVVQTPSDAGASSAETADDTEVEPDEPDLVVSDVPEEEDADDGVTCVIWGCYAEFCLEDSPDLMLAEPECNPQPEHACLSLTTCGISEDGTCDWDMNAAYEACLDNPPPGDEPDADIIDGDGSESDAEDVGPEADASSGEADGEEVDEDAESDSNSGDLEDSGDTATGDDGGEVEDASSDAESDDAESDDAESDDIDAADAQPEPETLVDEIVPITEATAYEGGELYGMGVDPDGRVSIFWRAKRDDGLDDLVVSQSDPVVSAFDLPVPIVQGIAPLGITAGGGLDMDGDSHLLTWRDDPQEGTSRIVFRRAVAPSFEGEDIVLAESTSDTLYRPHIAFNAPATVCVLWQKNGNGNVSDVMLRCSLDGGETFGDERMVNPIAASASVSDAAFALSGDLVVAYHAKPSNGALVRIYTTTSADLGETFTSPLDMNTLGGADDGFDPTLIRGMDGTLHLAWSNGLPGLEGQAWITHSGDGITWSTPALMPTIQSQVALRSGRGSVIHASGEDAKLGYGCILNAPPNCGIQVLSSPDSGQNWGEPMPIPVTEDTTLLGNDMVSNVVDGYLHIAWWETLPNQLTKQRLKFITLEE